MHKQSLFGVLSLLLLAGALFGATEKAQAEPVDSGHAMVELIADHETVAPGQSFRAALVLDIAPGWHVYWKNAGDAGFPPSIIWDEGAEPDASEFSFPAPYEQPLDNTLNYGYEDELIVPFEIRTPETASGTYEVTGSADILICKDICIPEFAPVSLSLNVGDSPVLNSAKADVFTKVDAQLPIPFDGEAIIDRSEAPWQLSLKNEAVRAAFDAEITNARFFPEDHQILHPPKQPVSLGADGITLSLTEAPGMGGTEEISGVLVIEDVDQNRIAFELTATPGTAMVGTFGNVANIGGPAPSSTGMFGSLGVTGLLGILGLAFIGGAILNLMPCVLPVLFIKARSLLPLAGSDRMDEIRAHGVVYALGVVTCFVAFGAVLAALRAAGETAGLGFQLQYPPVVAGLALLMFVLGLNMLGWFDIGGSVMGVGSGLAEKSGHQGAFFTGLLAAFVGAPCVGPFIGAATGVLVTQPVWIILLVFATLGLGMAAPFLVVSLFPKLVSMLPKPGGWMERLKQFFAFPLFLTAVWLVWVLANQAGSLAVGLVGVAATLIAFAIWLFKSAPAGKFARNVVFSIAGLILILGGVTIPFMLQGTKGVGVDEAGNVTAKGGYDEVWAPETVASLQAEGKGVFVDFTASWCVTCQVNKRTTLQSASVQKAFEEQGVSLLIADWTSRNDLIADELAKFGRAGVPLYLYYPKGGGAPEVLPQILSPSLVIETISTS
ncbi:MAG: cytochrome C biogenesis protein [Ponticaulis sp.]|nr:cytochrome C biogenesis protein [Ponticaulis sp.]|tara:strand:+ start:3368 stop:5530 length:2163 start_codon:yes stop_codon:yes gene_type:complete